MKNKTIRACFHLHHFYLDISSYLVLLNDIVKKKIILFIQRPIHGTVSVQDWFPCSVLFLCVGGEGDGGEFG